MNIFRKRQTALLVLGLAILAAMAIGRLRRPQEEDVLILRGEMDCVSDEAGILSPDTERYIDAMNASLFPQCGGMIYVATVETTGGADIVDYARDLGEANSVGSRERSNGLVLLLAPGNLSSGGLQGDYCIAYGAGLEDYAGQLEALLSNMEIDFAAGDYDAAVLTAFGDYIAWFEDHYGIRVEEGSAPAAGSYSTAHLQSYAWQPAAFPMGVVVALLAVILVLWIALDRLRYRRYRRRYGGWAVPPVIYRPIFWGRSHRPRPPMPPHHPPVGGGFSGGFTRGSVFGGGARRSFTRGGSFGGGFRRGGSFRGGGFSRGGFRGGRRR